MRRVTLSPVLVPVMLLPVMLLSVPLPARAGAVEKPAPPLSRVSVQVAVRSSGPELLSATATLQDLRTGRALSLPSLAFKTGTSAQAEYEDAESGESFAFQVVSDTGRETVTYTVRYQRTHEERLQFKESASIPLPASSPRG